MALLLVMLIYQSYEQTYPQLLWISGCDLSGLGLLVLFESEVHPDCQQDNQGSKDSFQQLDR